MYKAMLALEEETGQNLFRYSKELSFLRQMILEGLWDDVENFLELSQIRDKINYREVSFLIGKQRYLELLNSQQLDDQNYLLTVLKNLENLCQSKDQYNGLCYLLTLKSLNEHPDYQNWSLQRGRMECFEAIKDLMQQIFGDVLEKRKMPSNRLLKLMKDSINYQYFVAKSTGAMTKLKFDPITQASEVSLLKDIINPEAQQKFHRSNLNEVKIAFYTRRQQQQQNPQHQNMSMMQQQIEYDESDQIPDEIEDEDDDNDDEEEDNYYDNQFAQSMPAQFSMGSQGQKQQQPKNMMAQSINQNFYGQAKQQTPLNVSAMSQKDDLSRMIQQHQQQKQNQMLGQSLQNFSQSKQYSANQTPQSQYQNEQMSAIQQQMANDKQYKAISYHKQKASFDQNDFQNRSINNSTLQNASLNMGRAGAQSNFEFQRPTANFNDINQQSQPMNCSIVQSQKDSYAQQLQNQKQNSQHMRTNSKGSQFSSQNSQQHSVAPNFGMNQQSQIEMLPGNNSSFQSKRQSNQPQKQAKTQQNFFDNANKSGGPAGAQKNNFIFQNDSDQDDHKQIKKEEVKFMYRQATQPQQKQDPYLLNQSQQKMKQSVNQKQQSDNEEEEDEEQYHEDFEDPDQHLEEQESDTQSQQQSVRQIPQNRQQQQQNNNPYLDTEENPQQLISDIDPSIDNNIYNLTQKAYLLDGQPIRAACFNPQGSYIALGTNSKSVKICALPHLNDDDDEDEDDNYDNDYSSSERRNQKEGQQKLQVIFENENHHNGSIYCLDWSRTSRLIASGSNDRMIKILICPDLQDQQNNQELLILPLLGHSAIVRTVCFNPVDEFMLLSGGLNDHELKVWNSESGKNVANLKGHSGSIYSIKMTSDGSTAMSVGTDKFIRLWDVRTNHSIFAIDGTQYADMNEICFSSSPSIDGSSGVEDHGSLNGLACVGHVDGLLTFWDMKMRRCLAQSGAHSSEARGVSFTADGKYLASAGFDSQIVITDTSDLDNPQTVKTLSHDDKVVSVRWHPFLPMLLSTSADKTARIWYPQMPQ